MNRIEFTFDEMPAFAALVAALNANGVPYTVRRDKVAIEIAIGTGH